jgi:hypothetical protein
MGAGIGRQELRDHRSVSRNSTGKLCDVQDFVCRLGEGHDQAAVAIRIILILQVSGDLLWSGGLEIIL